MIQYQSVHQESFNYRAFYLQKDLRSKKPIKYSIWLKLSKNILKISWEL